VKPKGPTAECHPRRRLSNSRSQTPTRKKKSQTELFSGACGDDAVAMATLRDEGFVTGWRDELYPVAERFGATPAFLVERAAAGYFGIKGYGVHVNGYVQMADGSKKMVHATCYPCRRVLLPLPHLRFVSSVASPTASSTEDERKRHRERLCVMVCCDVCNPNVRRLTCTLGVLGVGSGWAVAATRSPRGQGCWTTSWRAGSRTVSAWWRTCARSARRRRPFPWR